MVFRVLLVLGALLWSPAHATLGLDFGRYHALVIGINDYENLPRLETAVADATAVANVLRHQYGFDVRLLLDATRDDVIHALDQLRAELTEHDNLLIYYAGHGVLDKEADIGSWLPVDAEEETQADWIPISTVTGTVKAMSAKHVMVVSDSCYSGTLTRGIDLSFRIKTGGDRGAVLRRLAAKRSRTALVSGGLEPVYDGGGDGHSVFARAFLAALRENTQVLDGHQLFTTIRGQVIVNADQTPNYGAIRRAGHDDGEFLFVPVTLGEPDTAQPSQTEGEDGIRASREFDAERQRRVAAEEAAREAQREIEILARAQEEAQKELETLRLELIARQRLEGSPGPTGPDEGAQSQSIGKLVATAVGTLLGAYLGDEIGKSLGRADQLYMRQAEQQALVAPVGDTIAWSNSDSGNSGTVTPVREGTHRDTGLYCREFHQRVTVGGRSEEAYGTACQLADGTWQIVGG